MISREDFINLISDSAKSAYDFHTRFNIESITEIGSNTEEVKALWDEVSNRLSLLSEELGEAYKDYNHRNLVGALEEFADVLYVAIGTIAKFGRIGEKATRNVIAKNDKKTKDTYEWVGEKIVKIRSDGITNESK